MPIDEPGAALDTISQIEQIDALLSKIESIRYDDYQQVITLAKVAHAQAAEEAYWPGVAKSLYHIADGYLRLGNYALASAPAQQALIAARTHGLAVEEAFALSALGAVYSYLGDEAEATHLFFQQLTIAEQHNHQTLMGYAYGDLGSLYLRTDSFEKGLDLIKKSNQIFDRLGREEEKYLWFFDVGNFYSERGDFIEAYDAYAMMYSLGQKKNITEANILGLTGMAKAKSNLQEYNIAHQYIDQALSIIQLSNSFLKCEVVLERGKIYARQNQTEAAIITLNTTLELATETQHWKVLMEAQQLLCDLYETIGDFKQALTHHRAYYEARDRNFNERSDSRTQILRTLYEIETVRKEAEIHQLRLQSAEHELDEYKQAESKRLELERLKLALDKERELVTLKERILTRLSHEFRTPLSIIRTSTEILTRYANRLTEEKREIYQGRIDEQFKWIEKLLNDISAVLKTDQKTVFEAKEAVSIRELCTLSIKNAQLQTKDFDRVELEVKAPSDNIWIEQEILLEIITNLLSNALKFSEDKVQLIIETLPDMLVIEVVDKGIGIPDDEQEKVFESLYRASNNDEVQGNGLGLTIVRDYLQLIGGKIDLQSIQSESTHITITIPLSVEPNTMT